ncbi:MAG TPA: AAA family ATPase [Gaiellaceae bacterium]|nr:AAA family ATPase [Gaiellaceae bacterium]
MAICASCGQENPEIARFCLACGLPLSDVRGAAREERRHVSVIFVDMVGFTARAERLDPEEVQELLRPYHDVVRREIESFGGVVEKFIGDAVVGVFGAPVAYGDDAERAVRAGLAVRDTIAAMDEASPRLDLKVRIAVNTGEALVIVDARPALGEAMVTGDVVNTAARLQTAAPVGAVLVGEETYRATKEAILFAPAEPVEAKGKEDRVPAWVALREIRKPGERPVGGPLIGRDPELDMLLGTWERVTTERTPHLVTVIGPAGVGKTRLAVELAAKVRERGGRPVRGRVLPYRESTAYSALAFQLKQLCGIFETDTGEVALEKLEQVVSTLLPPAESQEVSRHLAILLGLDPEGTIADRESLFFSIRTFIEAVAADQPTMLVFEDLHWADEALLQLVSLLAARLRDLPVLLLVLARPDLLDLRPDWGGGLLAHTALRLRPLDSAAATLLATHRLSNDGAAENLERAADLAAVADGNPLFIEQLAATLRESGDPAAPMPTTIRGIIAARLDALPANERTVLLNAAVAGRVFWLGALERMTPNPSGLSPALAELERRDLIARQTVSAFEGHQQYMFSHVLVRDVAYELLPRSVRQDRHREAALFFESVGGDGGEVGAALARHWRDAGEPEKAIQYLVTAAEGAEHGWAKERAAALYREALALVPEVDGDRRRQLTRRIALAETAKYHVPDARLLGLSE